jgi:hypothetical protein
MEHQDGRRVAMKLVSRLIAKDIEIKRIFNLDDLPTASGISDIAGSRSILVSTRERLMERMNMLWTGLHSTIILDETIAGQLHLLRVDPFRLAAEAFRSHLSFPPPKSTCAMRHRDLFVAFRCRNCRMAAYELALRIACILAFRRHPVTKENPCFLKIGFPGVVSKVLEDLGLYPETVTALLDGLNADEIRSLECSH